MATLEVSEEVLGLVRALAERLGTEPSKILEAMADVVATYSRDLEEWALDMRVKKEHRVEALMEELVYYAVATKKFLVDRVLEALRARGRFELEHLEIDPDRGWLEMEFVAFEGSDLLADRLRVGWGPDGVIVEATYYLDEDVPPPRYKKPRDPRIEIDYLPDEHAILVTARGRSLREVPPVHVLDRIAPV